MAYAFPGPNPYQSSGDKSAPSMNAWFEDVRLALADQADMARALFGTATNCVVACADYGLDAGKVAPETPEAMQVEVSPTRCYVDGCPLHIATGQHPTFVAPTGDPRIDLIAVSAISRAFVVRTGYEAPSPVAPTPADDEIPLAWIHLQPGMTGIYATETTGEGHIEDKRVWLNVA